MYCQGEIKLPNGRQHADKRVLVGGRCICSAEDGPALVPMLQTPV